MAFEYTVKQCAHKLGITEQRVYQLIAEGALPAEKIAGRYFIEEAAVETRMVSNPAPGRPYKFKSENVTSYTLMNRTHEVLDVEYDEDAGEFSRISSVHDISRAPFGLTSPRGNKPSLRELTYWWAHRSIPVSRAGMNSKLAELGISDPSRIPFKSLGLSLSDQYWLRPKNSHIEWQDINFFSSPFSELDTDGWLDQVGLDSPDNTSEGQLSKKWIKIDNIPYLLKSGGPLDQEPYNECVATALFKRCLQSEDFINYELTKLASGETVSQCPDFISAEEEYIPAQYVMRAKKKDSRRSDYQHYVECCERLGVENIERSLAKMIVCDDILGNTDRHWRNFGLVRNMETLEYRVAPLFDTGNSLWISSSEQALRSGDFTFTTKPFYSEPNRQLRLAEDYSWLSVEALDGFSDEAIEILSANSLIKGRLPYIKEAIEQRIARIRVIK